MVGIVLTTRTKDTLVDAPFLILMQNVMILRFSGIWVTIGWTMIGTPAPPVETGTKRTPTKSQPVIAVRMQNFTTSPQKRKKGLDKLYLMCYNKFIK